MNPLFQKLLLDGPILTDGAWGTEFRAVGLEAGQCADGWNLTRPDDVLRVGESYVDAGSRIILTNTFRANRLALESYGLNTKTEAINRAGVELSLHAARQRAIVFGSIGPARNLSTLQQPPNEELLFETFQEQARILANAGAHGIVLETFTDLHETLLAVLAAKTTELPVVASVVFDSGTGRDRMASGHAPEDVAKTLTNAGADIIGANCGFGIESSLPICKRLHASTNLPIWMKPNAGVPTLIGNRVVYPTSPRNFAMYAQVLSNLGADFIGGCCGTTPEFITEITRTLKRKYSNRMLMQE